MHISALFAYSVLLASAVLIIWAMRNEGAGSTLGKTVGSLIFVLSLFSMLCIGFYGIKYWNQGGFETPSEMSMAMRKEMMQKMMPQMMDKMKEHMGKMGNMGMQNGENPSHPSN
jgi:hypothetical protein